MGYLAFYLLQFVNPTRKGCLKFSCFMSEPPELGGYYICTYYNLRVHVHVHVDCSAHCTSKQDEGGGGGAYAQTQLRL